MWPICNHQSPVSFYFDSACGTHIFNVVVYSAVFKCLLIVVGGMASTFCVYICSEWSTFVLMVVGGEIVCYKSSKPFFQTIFPPYKVIQYKNFTNHTVFHIHFCSASYSRTIHPNQSNWASWVKLRYMVHPFWYIRDFVMASYAFGYKVISDF